MNVLKLMKIWKILSIVWVIFIPIIWIGLNYFDLLLVKFLWHTLYTWVYIIAWYSVIFTMMIRPLSDLLPQYKSLKQLCLLRRAFWIISAMIICTLLIDRWISNPSSLMSFFTLSEWWFTSWPSFTGFFSLPEWDWTEALMAKLSDVTALILLVTSNNFSQKLLKKNWKRV